METLAETPSGEADPAAPHLWQLWRPFSAIHDWFYSPGTPPPLRNLSGWEAVVQISVLCAGMGFLAGIFTFAGALALSFLPHQFSALRFPLTGFIYAVLVVYPLSRWIGRSILWSAGGAAMCVIAWCGQFILYQMIPSLLNLLFGGGIAYYVYYAEFRILRLVLSFGIPAVLLAIYMCGSNPRMQRVLPAVFLAVVAIAFGLELLRASGPLWPGLTAGSLHHQIMCEMMQALPLVWYEVFLSMALGILLWPVTGEMDTAIDRPSEPA